MKPVHPDPEVSKVDPQIPSVHAYLHAKRTRENEFTQREREHYEYCLKRIRMEITSHLQYGSMSWSSHDLYYSGTTQKAADAVVAEMRQLGYTVTLTELPKNNHVMYGKFKIEWTVDEKNIPPAYEDVKMTSR